MPEYLVTWEIDATGLTPLEAAKEAWRAMRRKDSTACVFTVREKGTDAYVTMDLQDLSRPGAPRKPTPCEQCGTLCDGVTAARACCRGKVKRGAKPVPTHCGKCGTLCPSRGAAEEHDCRTATVAVSSSQSAPVRHTGD